MPTVTIEVFEGRTLDQKRSLVAALTAAVVQSLDVDAALVRVKISELSRENSAWGGVLNCDGG